MIANIFNSTLVSGPETLVLPALSKLNTPITIIFLSETRRALEAQNPIEYAKSLGLQTLSIPVTSRYDRPSIAALSQSLRAPNLQVVHAHDVKASTYLLKASQKVASRNFKLFSTHHGVHARSGFRNHLYEFFYSKTILPYFDQALCVCSSDRQILLNRGLDPQKVQVHLNGVDRKYVSPHERSKITHQIRKNWNLESMKINHSSLIFGIVGRLSREKRHDRLLKTLARLIHLAPHLKWHLLCFGTGPLEADLKRLTQKLQLHDRVHWMGYRKEIGNEMAGFDLLFSLSDAEGLPINLLEAGWAGTPVIATAVDGNQDLIQSRKHGILVPRNQPTDAIAAETLQLLSQPTLRITMGFHFQERVTQAFSESVWIERLQELYQI